MTNEKMMKEAPVWKLILKMSIPTVVIMLMNVLYNMADVFFLGRTGDAMQVAAASLAGPVFSILSGLGVLIGQGACTAIAIALGQGERDDVKKLSSFSFWSALAVGVASCAAILAFTNPLCTLLGATAETAGFTASYMRVLALGAPAMMIASVLGNVTRGDGSSIEPMVIGLIGNMVNIAMDPLLILTLGMGITGAALATVCGNVVSCLCLFVLMKKKGCYSVSPKHFTLRKNISLRVLGLGLPMASGVLLQSFSGVFGNRLAVKYGSIVIAARSVSGTVGMLLCMIIMGVCMGIQPAMSYVYGTGDKKRLSKITLTTGAVCVVLGTVMGIGAFSCRRGFVSMFMSDPEIVEMAAFMAIGGVIALPVYAVYQMCTTYLQATGKVSFATVTSLLRQGIVMVPVLFIMEAIFGLNGIIFSGAVADVLSTAAALLMCRVWIKQQAKPANITEQDEELMAA